MSHSAKFQIIIPPQDIHFYPDCLPQLAAGSKKAFEWLYQNYSRKTYEYFLLMTRNEMFSEDMVQMVFSKIWEKRQRMATVQNFNAYLHIMMRNYLNNYWRKQALEQRSLEDYKNRIASHQEEIDKHLEVFKMIMEAVEHLPTQQKLVYHLKRECNWKREKIAARLNIAPNTVKAHMQKALSQIRDYVKERMEQ